MKVALVYLPVPHRGYREFFQRQTNLEKIFLLGNPLITEFKHLRKNLPALSPEEVQKALLAMNWVNVPIEIANFETLRELNNPDYLIILPDEDVCNKLSEKYLSLARIKYDNTFLRWDMNAITAKKDVIPDCKISSNAFDQQVMGLLVNYKLQSSDFWRQVGAAIIKRGEILAFAHNTQVPDPETPYFFGDPRFNFSRGVEIDTGTGEHAERKLISLCAKKGIATEHTSLYTTTFPCPPCAKAIASAGIKHIYFREGYASLDSEIVLKAANIELILIK